MEMITARHGVDDVVKELPAIRDTARKITTIFDELPITAAKVSGLHDELPTISGKITEIYDDMPAMAGKVTLIYDELPAIRDALERLAVRFYASLHLLSLRRLIIFKSYNNKLISLQRLLHLKARVYSSCPLHETVIL
jgi:hypothetical protein